MSVHTKPSVTKIVREIFPTDPIMFQKALSQESMEKKTRENKILPNSLASKVKYLIADEVMFVLNTFGSIIHNVAFDI